MNRIKRSLTAKIVAFVLLVLFAFSTLFNGLASFAALSENYYTKSKQDVVDEMYSDITYEISTMIYNNCYFDTKGNMNVSYGYHYDVTELADFVIYHSVTGEILHISTNPIGSGYLATNSSYFRVYYSSYYSSKTGQGIEGVEIKVMLKPFKENSILELREKLTLYFYDNRFLSLIAFLICVIISLSLFSFLIMSAGWKKENTNVTTGILEKIPFDIFTLLIGLAIGGLAVLTFGIAETIQVLAYNYTEPFILKSSVIVLLLLAAGSIFVIWAMSFAKRIKSKTTLKSCVTYKIFRFLFKKFKRVIKFVFLLFKNLKLVWKVVLFVVAVTALELIISIIGDEVEYYVFLSILEKLFFVPAIIYIAILLQRLKNGGKKLAEGDIESKINTEYMFGDFKEHAENLNSVGDGVAVAVEERLKSERFKTELITNVSHDIKTPLTSVINYVDLIKQEKPKGEKINKYLDVLERQSNRLKKLVEDLVEASKASSGSIAVELLPCDGNILLEQAAGEYEEKFQSAGLDLIIKKSDEPIMLMADGRHLGRVFDNLLNNIYKHAMPGSRVYLSLNKTEDKAEFCFKNISKYELDISADELTERFVRADKSRNTEGSGLGLSIAKSLTELQNGEFKIITDGDLFKAILLFKLI